MLTSGIVFNAPWGLSLRLITTITTGILVTVAAIGMIQIHGNAAVWIISMIVLPLSVLVGGAVFMIRGYELGPDKLLVQRLGWKTTIDLTGLQSVKIDPEAMKRSVRTFGNGGLFCFAGKFWNKKLGSYRAYATDPRLAVVLKFENRTAVVTPDEPATFKARLENPGLAKR